MFCTNCGEQIEKPLISVKGEVCPHCGCVIQTCETPKGDPNKNGKAIASLVLGIVSLITWLIPLFGYPTSIIGIILSVSGMKSENKGMGIAGLVMSIIALVACIANSAIGAYIGSTSF